jgi:hypothetical protein
MSEAMMSFQSCGDIDEDQPTKVFEYSKDVIDSIAVAERILVAGLVKVSSSSSTLTWLAMTVSGLTTNSDVFLWEKTFWKIVISMSVLGIIPCLITLRGNHQHCNILRMLLIVLL